MIVIKRKSRIIQQEVFSKMFRSGRQLFLGFTLILFSGVLFAGNGLKTYNSDLKVDNEYAQPIHITGTVTDVNGKPLPGVNINIQGTTRGAVTNLKGEYTIEVNSGDEVLHFSYIGFISQDIAIGSKRTINVTLEENIEALEEVVVVGYGSQKKETVTGAISSIDTEDLLQSPQANITNALAGRMPGLVSVQRSGLPGADDATLRIRGIGTFTGVQEPLIMIDGIEAPGLNEIDPNVVESITILKDASATAVYGVRGANGVVLVTTKRGEKGKGKLKISANFALHEFYNLRSNMGSYEYAKAYNEGYKYDSYVTQTYIEKFSEEEIEKFRTGEDPIFYPDTDWKEIALKPFAGQQQVNINYSGGTDNVRYFVSAGFLNQSSLFTNFSLNDDFDPKLLYQRYNVRSNFDFDITKRLVISLDVSSQMQDRRNISLSGAQYNMRQIYLTSPTVSPGIIDNKVIQNEYVFTGSLPIEDLVSWGQSTTFTNQLNSNLGFKYDLDFITEGLSIHGKVSYQNFHSLSQDYSRREPSYEPKRLPDSTIVYVPLREESTNFSFSEGVGKHRRIYSEVGLNYYKEIYDHTFTGLLLYNRSKLYDPGLAYLVPHGYHGLVGRLTYDYKRKYMAELNLGYNGTENFAEGKRFGLFPAISLGWTISEESFFPENRVVSYLKIRGSYGEVGNDKVGGARFMYRPSSYEYGGLGTVSWADGVYWGIIGSSYNLYGTSSEGLLGNPNLTWERARKSNIGLEASFWNGRIRFSGDYFYEYRNNILAQKGTVPVVFGVSSSKLPSYNLGEMENSGFDGEISYNHAINNLSYWVKANFTYAHNEILFQDEVERDYEYLQRTGHRVGQYYGLIAEGFYNSWEEVNPLNRPISIWNGNRLQPGDIKYRDVNSDGFIDNDDMVPIGYSNFPEIMYGISFGFNYKGFDLSVLFQGAANVSLVTPPHMRRGFSQDGGAPDYLLGNSWSYELIEQGVTPTFPRLGADNTLDHNYVQSTLWVRDASYTRLKNVEIGYNFSAPVLQRLKIDQTRIFANGNNLYTWADLLKGQDPENASNTGSGEPYPPTRIYNLGIRITF